MKKFIFAFITVTLLACVVAVPRVSAAEDRYEGAAVKSYSKSYEHVDIAHYVDKLKDIFFTEEFKAEHPMAVMIEKLIDAYGYFAIDSYEGESVMAHGKVTVKETLWFNEDYPDSFFYRWFTVPNYDFKIGSFLADDDYVLLLSLTGWKERGPIFVDYMQDVEAAMGEEEDADIASALGFLGMFQLNPEMLEALGNEIDFVVFDAPDVTHEPEGPEDFNAALMVPVEDREGVDSLVKMVSGMAGFDMEKPGFSTVEWDFYPLMGTSAGLGVSSEWVVLATNYQKFAEFARGVPTKKHQDLPRGSMYMRVDVDRLYDELGMPLLTMLKAECPQLADKEIGYFFDVYPEADLGACSVHVSNWRDHALFVSEADDDVMNLLGYAVCIAGEYLAREKMGERSDQGWCGEGHDAQQPGEGRFEEGAAPF